MNTWILTSFYTFGTGYAKLAPRFKDSALTAGIGIERIEIGVIPNLRDWHKNTRQKALLIWKNLIKFEGLYDAIVFVDIDAVFHSYPKLFNLLDCDFAAHFRNWRHGRNELLSGTLFFRINKRSCDLVEEWIKLNKQHQNIWEQKNLQRAFKRVSPLKHDALPIEYCTIFDDQNRQKIDPVIEHFQASRRLRYEVSK